MQYKLGFHNTAQYDDNIEPDVTTNSQRLLSEIGNLAGNIQTTNRDWLAPCWVLKCFNRTQHLNLSIRNAGGSLSNILIVLPSELGASNPAMMMQNFILIAILRHVDFQ